MSNSKTKNASINSLVGIVSQIFQIILSFATRTIFIKLLGADYLGINGIYTNILSILSITELGIGNILIFYLYKPLVNKDNEKIIQLLKFSKKAYYAIALFILFVGLLLIPILPYIIDSDLTTINLIKYYIIFLLNSVISYLFIYKTNLLYADQQSYKLTLLSSTVITFQYITQILVLILFHNYTLYLIVLLVSTFFNNFFASKIADKNYPYLRQMEVSELTTYEKKNIIEDVKSMFIYKSGSVIMNYTDNILISIFVGTIFVGYYSNYLLIITMINTFISIIIRGITGSIGNLIAEEDKARTKDVFYIFTYFFQFIGIICTSCLLFLFNDFINIWIGSEYLLDNATVIITIVSFYITCINNQNWIFREAGGLYKNVRLVMIIAAIINLILSIIFGYLYGLSGVLVSTLIARLLTLCWYDPLVLSKNLFVEKFKYYLLKQFKYFFILLIVIFMDWLIPYNNVTTFVDFIIKGFFIFINSTFWFLLLNIKNKDQKNMFMKIKYLLNQVLKK